MKLQKKILNWYTCHKRDLPWRNITDPYLILVSEIMLQQTQVERVIPYYKKFCKTYPDMQTLAKAKKEEVLQLWSGLGYNNRVLRLQKIAQLLQDKPFPQTKEELLKLPGIGEYTANAILAFSFNKEVPVMDTNIRRVLIHELKLKEDISIKELQEIAQKLIPKGQSRLWHNALMDYGSLLATAKKTRITSLSKQSTFEGSERQVRGQIIKTLLKEKQIPITKIEKRFLHSRLIKILEKMEEEKLIERKGSFLRIPD